MSIAPGVRLGAYEVVSLIGAGGMGEVYRARDTRLGRTVAIKVLAPAISNDETARHRLLREARTISSLDHPNICALYDVGHDQGIDYLVMQYLEGDTLAARLREGALPVDTALRYATEIASALDAAHARGVVHRDLKPANVMITSSGARLLDFGLALPRRFDAASASAATTTQTGSVLTEPGMVIGTLPYMAPEQLEGHPADARSDIFSFGTMFYEMLTGRRPFAATAGHGVMTAILGVTPPPPSHLNDRIPPALDAIVARCLEKDASRRWQRMSDVRAATSAASAAVSKRPRGIVYAAAAAVIAIAAVVSVIVGLPDSGDSSRTSGVTSSDTATVIALLPFEADTGDAAERAYWIGLSEAVSEKLAQLPPAMRVHVVSAADIQSRNVRTADDARLELGATRIVRGRQQRTNGVLEVSLELIDTKTSQTGDSTLVRMDRNDPAASQNALLEAVLELLDIAPSASVRARLMAPRGVPGAYDYYLQAIGHMQDYDRPENLDSAIAVLKRALELDPDHAPAYAGLGRAYWRKYESTRDPQWVETARQSCERALGLDEAEAAPHLCLATVESGVGRYEKAVEEYQHAAEREPDNEVAYLGLAEAYSRLKDPAKAEETFLRAVRLRPRYWYAHSALGTFYYQAAKYSEAEQAFKQVIALNPDSWRAYSNLGGVLYAQGRPEEAVAAFEQSLTLRPNYQAASNLGTVYFYELGDYRRAAHAFERAIAINKTPYVLWGNLAWSLHWSGDRSRARDAFEQAATLAEARRRVNPRDATTLMALAEFRAALGARTEARELTYQALALAPENPRLLYSAGVLHEHALGERERAIEFLAGALARGHPWKEVERDPGLSRLRRDGGLDRLRQTVAARRQSEGG